MIYRNSDRSRTFTRRALVLGGGKFLLISALVGRMYYLQILESDKYKTLSEENRINMRLLAPPRGRIFDRNGAVLADNQQDYRIAIIREQAGAEGVEPVLKMLRKIVYISDADYTRVLEESSKKRGFVPITVRENLTWRDVAEIETQSLDLPGAMIREGQTRAYPQGADCAHIVGYVAQPSEKDLKEDGDPLLELPDFRIGKAGMERVYDDVLRGKGGASRIEVNALGRVIREVERREGTPGRDISLTLDSDYQSYVLRRLGEESASAVVMDVHQGDILALASSPTFDPDAFTKGLSQTQWDAWINDPRAPLRNKAIAGQYSPGSTFKTVVALAALEHQVVDTKKRFWCPGHLKLGNRQFHCWKRGGHGWVDMSDALKYSCDVFFYEVALRLGIERIAAMSRRMGLGHSTEIGLPDELSGLMPDKIWKMGAKGEPWQQGETLIAGIGQGYILTTPLQLAVMTARLVNGGRAVKPRLLLSGTGEPPPQPEQMGLSRLNLDFIRDATSRVVNERRGTAYRSRIDEEGMEMGGKTGTVQVRRITKAERLQGVRKNEDLPWKFRDHALFIGYAPVAAPRFAAAVVVEHGGSGSRAAAPIAKDILHEIQRRRDAGGDTAALTPGKKKREL
ncbi:MAG: penicillin-binding protein 2 [Magnetospiraceae bacterium]